MTRRIAGLAFVGFLTIVFTAEVISITAQVPRLTRNGKIAFTSDRDGNREIYVMNGDGSNQTRLTNNSIVDDHATWSPDGRKIAFVSERQTGGRAIFTMNSDGTGRTEVTPVTYVDRYLQWPFFIWTDFYSMDWSPDGTRIVFQDNYDIVIVNADGSNRHAITDGTSYDLEPAWSSDGSKIVFSRDPLDDGGLQYGRLSTVNIDGSNVQFLPNAWQAQEYAPKWSPSGDKILFVIEFTDDIAESVIYVTNADGSNDQLFDGNPAGVYEYRNKPGWSPDGRKILFDKVVYGTYPMSDLEIYVGNTDHTGSIQLTNTDRWNFNPSWQPLANSGFDFDGDGKADRSTFRPTDGIWYLDRSTDGPVRFQWGASTDRISPADYDGDGKTDVAVYRPSEGRWYVLNSSTSTFSSALWGTPSDIPTTGDYDADGRADVAIFRPSDGNWWINRSTQGTLVHQFGANGDHPVVGDYDGDGYSDIAVFRPAIGVWFINRSTAGILGYQFGISTDKVVPADYDGDGKTDIAVYRSSEGKWFIANSGSPTHPVLSFGAPNDIPTPADYDGDGRADIAVFRPSDGNWWIYRTTAGLLVQQFGQNGDRPTPSAFGN